MNFIFFIIYLIHLNKRIKQNLHTCCRLLGLLNQVKFHPIKAYGWKLQATKRRRRHLQVHRHQPPRNQMRYFDLYETAGVFPHQFEDLFSALRPQIILPRNQSNPKKPCLTTLSPPLRLLLTLDYLRNGPKYKRFVDKYNISRSQVCKEVQHILPKVYVQLAALDIIKPPPTFTSHFFENVVGMWILFIKYKI